MHSAFGASVSREGHNESPSFPRCPHDIIRTARRTVTAVSPRNTLLIAPDPHPAAVVKSAVETLALPECYRDRVTAQDILDLGQHLAEAGRRGSATSMAAGALKVTSVLGVLGFVGMLLLLAPLFAAALNVPAVQRAVEVVLSYCEALREWERSTMRTVRGKPTPLPRSSREPWMPPPVPSHAKASDEAPGAGCSQSCGCGSPSSTAFGSTSSMLTLWGSPCTSASFQQRSIPPRALWSPFQEVRSELGIVAAHFHAGTLCRC